MSHSKSVSKFCIKPARSKADLEVALQLFNAYAASLGIDLTFQNFHAEIAALPGKYARPDGEILLAYNMQGAPLGCVALRSLAEKDCCEMKRLYVVPSGRGLGLGKALLHAIVEEAARIGHKTMRLDTLATMVEAMALYRSIGFRDIAAYYDTPIAGTVFMELSLESFGPRPRT